LDGDAGSVVRNNLASQLVALGLRLGGTGTWESQSLPTQAAVGLMQAIASRVWLRCPTGGGRIMSGFILIGLV